MSSGADPRIRSRKRLPRRLVMRHRFLAIALTLLATSGAPAAGHAAGPLVLNEILAGPARDWDGSGTFSSRDDEWVELVNTGATPLDLGGFLITDGDSIPRYAL